MAAVLYHYLTDADFREKVDREHEVLSGQLDRYLRRLREEYGEELEIEVQPEEEGGG